MKRANAGAQSARESSLVVTLENGYTQTLNLPFDAIQLKLSNTLVPPQVLLEELDINDTHFRPATPVVYRPLDINGTVIPLQRWGWTLQSDVGSATLTQSSIAQLPEVELRGTTSTLVQRVDSILTFGGNAAGTVTLSQWEGVGDPHYMRLRAEGTVVVLGKTYLIDMAALLGHSGFAFNL